MQEKYWCGVSVVSLLKDFRQHSSWILSSKEHKCRWAVTNFQDVLFFLQPSIKFSVKLGRRYIRYICMVCSLCFWLCRGWVQLPLTCSSQKLAMTQPHMNLKLIFMGIYSSFSHIVIYESVQYFQECPFVSQWLCLTLFVFYLTLYLTFLFVICTKVNRSKF